MCYSTKTNNFSPTKQGLTSTIGDHASLLAQNTQEQGGKETGRAGSEPKNTRPSTCTSINSAALAFFGRIRRCQNRNSPGKTGKRAKLVVLLAHIWHIASGLLNWKAGGELASKASVSNWSNCYFLFLPSPTKCARYNSLICYPQKKKSLICKE